MVGTYSAEGPINDQADTSFTSSEDSLFTDENKE